MTPLPWVLAHRGATRTARENSLAALSAAHRLGCDGAEIDVQRLGDGTFALHHDAALYVGRRRVALRRLDRARLDQLLPRAERPPTLDAVAQWAKQHRGFLLNVELKPSAAVPSVLAELDRLRRADTVVTSFDRRTVVWLAQARPRLHRGWLRRRASARTIRAAKDAGISLLVLHVSAARPPLLQAARSNGLSVWCWGLNQVPQARRLAQRGVAAFITDAPGQLLQSRKRKRRGV